MSGQVPGGCWGKVTPISRPNNQTRHVRDADSHKVAELFFLIVGPCQIVGVRACSEEKVAQTPM